MRITICNTIMNVIVQEILINKEKCIIVQEEQLSLLFKG